MNTKIVIYALLLLSGGGALAAPEAGRAAESTSFRLYDELSNFAERTPQTSTSFVLNENGLTWTQLPVVSSHFQIVSAPPPSSSPSSSSVSSSSSSSSASSKQPAGGHRGRGTTRGGTAPSVPHGAPPPRRIPRKSVKPSAPSQVSPDAPHGRTQPSVKPLPARHYRQIFLKLFRPAAVTTSPVLSAQRDVGHYQQRLLPYLDASLFGSFGLVSVLNLTDLLVLLLALLVLLLVMFLQQGRRKHPIPCFTHRQLHSSHKK